MLNAGDSPWTDGVQQVGRTGPGGVVNRDSWFLFVYAYYEVGPKSLRSI